MVIVVTFKGDEFRYHGTIEVVQMPSSTWVRANECQCPGYPREKMNGSWDNFEAGEIKEIKGRQ